MSPRANGCLLLTLVACGPSKDDSADTSNTDTADSHETDDTGDTGDTGDNPFDPSGFEDAPWYRALSVPADRGWTWDMDPNFALEGYSVPSILALDDGGYRLFLSDQFHHGDISMATSEDGISWDLLPDPVITIGLAGIEGAVLLDTSVFYMGNGRYRLLVEAWNEGNARTEIRAIATDGDTFAREEVETLEPDPSDHDITSVLGALWWAPQETFLTYYVGDWTTDDGDGIRLATSPDATHFEHIVTSNILDVGDVDPDPIRDEAGSVRLYHTAAHERPGVATSTDSVTFDDLGPMDSFEGYICNPAKMVDGDECLLDPSFLRLPDDTLVLYFSRLEMVGTDVHLSIVRAFATD